MLFRKVGSNLFLYYKNVEVHIISNREDFNTKGYPEGITKNYLPTLEKFTVKFNLNGLYAYTNISHPHVNRRYNKNHKGYAICLGGARQELPDMVRDKNYYGIWSRIYNVFHIINRGDVYWLETRYRVPCGFCKKHIHQYYLQGNHKYCRQCIDSMVDPSLEKYPPNCLKANYRGQIVNRFSKNG